MNAKVSDRFRDTSEFLPSRLRGVPALKETAPVATPEEALALSVLTQAVYDLRRFHEPTNSLERELYRDAYDWIGDTDFTWPYSFVNICRLLDVPPETLRAELLVDASLGCLNYWSKLGGRFARCLGACLAHTFQKQRGAPSPMELGLNQPTYD